MEDSYPSQFTAALRATKGRAHAQGWDVQTVTRADGSVELLLLDSTGALLVRSPHLGEIRAALTAAEAVAAGATKAPQRFQHLKMPAPPKSDSDDGGAA